MLFSQSQVDKKAQKKQEYWEQSWEIKNSGAGDVVMHGIAYLGVSRKLIDPLSQLRYVVQGKEDPVALARQNRVQNVKYFYRGMEMTLYDQVMGMDGNGLQDVQVITYFPYEPESIYFDWTFYQEDGGQFREGWC